MSSPEDERIELLSCETVYRGFFDLDVVEFRHRRFDGAWSGRMRRELFKIRDAVCVLPYDPARDEVVLIEQFRVGAMTHEGGAWLIECVAGLIDEGETPLATARRELLEEAGLACRRLERIGAYAATPGAVTERAEIFVAEVDTADAGGVHGLDHEGEDIRTHVLPAEQAFAWLDEGRISAANAQLPLRWLQVHRESLRQRWQSAA